MAYNNYFSNGFVPQYYPQIQPSMMTQTTQQQAQNNGIIWVQGIAGAKSYLLAPNTTVQLWDSEAQIIYLKSADASGMPSMKILDYTIRDEVSQSPQQATSSPTYVTKEEFDKFRSEVQNLIGGRNNESTLSTTEKQHSNSKQSR